MRTRNYFLAVVAGILMLLSTPFAALGWVVEENFDGADPVLSDGVRCPPFWRDNFADSTVTTENNISSGGSKSCKFSIPENGQGWGGGFVFPNNEVSGQNEVLGQGDEVWVRFRLYIPTGSDFNAYSSGNRLKFIRMTVRNAAGITARLDWYWQQEGSAQPYGVTLERDDCTTNCWQFFGTGDGPVQGVWETYEEYVKFDYTSVDDGGEGRVITWKNGKLLANMTNRPTMWLDVNNNLGGDGVEIINIMVFSYWNGGSPKAQFLYFDDLVATDTIPGSTCDDGGGEVPCIGVGDYVYVAPPGPPMSVSSPAETP